MLLIFKSEILSSYKGKYNEWSKNSHKSLAYILLAGFTLIPVLKFPYEAQAQGNLMLYNY